MEEQTHEQKRFESDRLSLIHRIVFNSELGRWELAEKYRSLYKEIYGDISAYTQLQTPPSIIKEGKSK